MLINLNINVVHAYHMYRELNQSQWGGGLKFINFPTNLPIYHKNKCHHVWVTNIQIFSTIGENGSCCEKLWTTLMDIDIKA